MAENLWILFANAGILFLYIYIAFFFVYLLLLLLNFSSRCFRCSNRFIKFLDKNLDNYYEYCLFRFLYIGMTIYGILFILSFLTNKGIFANEFLGG